MNKVRLTAGNGSVTLEEVHQRDLFMNESLAVHLRLAVVLALCFVSSIVLDALTGFVTGTAAGVPQTFAEAGILFVFAAALLFLIFECAGAVAYVCGAFWLLLLLIADDLARAIGFSD